MTAETCLVTGGSGFIGAALVKRLLSDGHNVKVMDNNFRGEPRRLSEVRDKVELIEADIRDERAVLNASRNVETIVHLAFINGTQYFYSAPDLVLDVALRGILNVLEACKRNDVAKLVLASSSEVYQTPLRIPTDEAVPLVIPDVLNPRYCYAAGKLISEVAALNFGRNKGFGRVIIFRPHNVYGPDMGWEHVIPQLATKAIRIADRTPTGPIPLPIQGDGSQTRSFVHIDDCAEAVMTLLMKGEHLNIYHVGNPEEVTIAQLATRIVERLGREASLVPGPLPEGGTPRRCPDITKLKGLGFSPRVPLEDGLGPTVHWYSENRSLWPKEDS